MLVKVVVLMLSSGSKNMGNNGFGRFLTLLIYFFSIPFVSF
jgi:hypothetical protein